MGELKNGVSDRVEGRFNVASADVFTVVSPVKLEGVATSNHQLLLPGSTITVRRLLPVWDGLEVVTGSVDGGATFSIPRAVLGDFFNKRSIVKGNMGDEAIGGKVGEPHGGGGEVAVITKGVADDSGTVIGRSD